MRIRCAQCQKPVDRIDVWHDPFEQVRTIKVYCHGAEDTMTMSVYEIARWSQDEIRQLEQAEGIAFTTPTIEFVP